jgi:hypothetical protein
MNRETLDQLIGQTAANATLLHALTGVLLQESPQLQPALARLVEATALTEKEQLSEYQRQWFEEHLKQLRSLWE